MCDKAYVKPRNDYQSTTGLTNVINSLPAYSQ